MNQDLEKELRNARDEINRLKRLESESAGYNSKIASLEASLSEKNRRIAELEARLRNLETELTRFRNLENELREKDREITALLQEKRNTQSVRTDDAKLKRYETEIEYLKEKIRSLEDLIDIFTEEHGILEAKIKEYRLREGATRENTEKFDKLFQDYNKLIIEIRNKDSEIGSLRVTIEELQRQAAYQKNNDSGYLEKIKRLELELQQARMAAQTQTQTQTQTQIQRQELPSQEREELLQRIRTLEVFPSFITEFVLRILMHFGDVRSGSAEEQKLSE